MLRISRLVYACLFLTATCYAQTATPAVKDPQRPNEKYGAFVVDAGGRTISSLEAGTSVYAGARALQPETTYEFRLGLDQGAIRSLKEAVSFARATTDRAGNIPPFVLWYQAGVIGCPQRQTERERRAPMTFRTFEESERALAGKVLTVSVHPVERDKTGRVPPQKLRVGDQVSVFQLPVIKRRNPAVYVSDRNGCLLNSQLTGGGDIFVSGLNFKPGAALEISVVPNQRAWYVNDPINDVTGVNTAAAPERVRADAQGRFTLKVWDKATQMRGVYDVIAHDLTDADNSPHCRPARHHLLRG
jgi:hypothetical protein